MSDMDFEFLETEAEFIEALEIIITSKSLCSKHLKTLFDHISIRDSQLNWEVTGRVLAKHLVCYEEHDLRNILSMVMSGEDSFSIFLNFYLFPAQNSTIPVSAASKMRNFLPVLDPHRAKRRQLLE